MTTPKALTVADLIRELSRLPQGSLLFRHEYEFNYESSTRVEHVTGVAVDGRLEFDCSASDHWLDDGDDVDDWAGVDFEPHFADLVDFDALDAKQAADNEADRAEDETTALARHHGYTID